MVTEVLHRHRGCRGGRRHTLPAGITGPHPLRRRHRRRRTRSTAARRRQRRISSRRRTGHRRPAITRRRHHRLATVSTLPSSSCSSGMRHN